jgi:type II secretory pathway pseudopilin PulG
VTPRPATRDEGYTLVETLITVLVVSIVLIAAFPVLPVFFRESNIVQNTYGSVDQLVLASEVATRYIHEAVATTTVAGANGVNPVQTANANNTTFYANTGNANGPEQVVMQVATAGTTRTFKVNLYVPTAGSCPGINVAGTGCTYGGSTQSFLLINFLTNGTGGNPVFTYTLQSGEVCGGPPPGAPTATLGQAALLNATTLHVASLSKPVAVGDTIFVGNGQTAQSVTATAAVAASPSAATTIPVTALASAAANGTYVYDTAVTTVPNWVPTTLSGTASSGATTLNLSTALVSPVSSGDTIVVGTGSSAQTVTAAAPGASVGATSIPVSALPSGAASNSEVYDSSCSASAGQIQAIALNLLATANPGGQPTGYQTLAYFLSPDYATTVG